jgi:carbamoyl-phosphate synthase small subunit
MGYLTLEDGSSFKGRLIGAGNKAIGELVFNTNMVGYQDVLTDPAGYGQIAVMTYPLIGNYGINDNDMRGLIPYLNGIVVRELCDIPSNWRATGNLNDYLIRHNITGISDIDTRALTAIIRKKGNLRGIITQNPPTEEELAELKAFKIPGAVEKVTCQAPYSMGEQTGIKVAVIDYGLNHNIFQPLLKRGLSVSVFPAGVSAERVLQGNFAGVILSGGPGDPKECAEEIAVIREIAGKLPIMAIGLGHLLLTLALGGDTKRLACSHCGSQPVKDTQSGRMYTTAQSHAYTVCADTLPAGARVSFINWNDRSVEGLEYENGDFGVQFYPQAGEDFTDTAFLIDKFTGRLKQ